MTPFGVSRPLGAPQDHGLAWESSKELDSIVTH
jgi:hypothetical protein